MKSTIPCAVAALLLSPALAAQSVWVEAQGTLAANTLTSGPFAGIAPGAAVHLALAVMPPGVVLAPGQYVNYPIDKPTFAFAVGGATLGLGAGAPALGIQDDFPAADGVHLFQTPLSQPGYFFEFELFDGTGGAIWDSTDITTLAGDYGAALFQKAAWNVNGGQLQVALNVLTIHAPAPPAAVVPYGCGVNPAGSILAQGLPKLGGAMSIGLHNPLGTQAPGSLTVLAANLGADPGFPCGTLLPGFGMAGGGAPAELLIGLGGPILPGATWSGSPAFYPVSIANDPALAGVQVFVQGAIVDPAPSALAPIALTGALELQIGA
jgi:hypothetical protein